MISLWRRLRERKLIQWTAAYLAGAWLVLQVVDPLGGFFRAYQAHSASFLAFHGEPDYDPIRADPRFAALLRKMRIP